MREAQLNSAENQLSDWNDATIALLVTESDRERFLRDVHSMYRNWVDANWRYEWRQDDPRDNSGTLHLVEMGEAPPITEWLNEYTGDGLSTFTSGPEWEHDTYSKEVFDLAAEVVGAAFQERFGPRCFRDAALCDAASEAQWMLYEWCEEQLKDGYEEERVDWAREGF